MTIDYDCLNRVPLRLRDSDRIQFVLVGCGGNGSQMAAAIAQAVYLLHQQGKEASAAFYDPDRVEPKNVPRQDFYPAELGLNKAQVLATRWSLRLGVTITGVAKAFTEAQINELHCWSALTILVGCVDNHLGRQAMAGCLTRNRDNQAPQFWWLDLGNTETAGQVVLGSASHARAMQSAFALKTVCTALPSPAGVYPNLLKPRPQQKQLHRSCADAAALNAQSQSVNRWCAAIATDYLNRMLFGELTKFATEFDTSTGTMRSCWISPESVKQSTQI